MATESVYARECRVELEEIELELKAQRLNGQETNIIGSFSRKGVSYKTLSRRRNELIGTLAALNGGKSWTLPNSG